MTYLTLAAFAAPIAHAYCEGLKAPVFSYRKVGGLRFLRIGRLQLSFCVCRKG